MFVKLLKAGSAGHNMFRKQKPKTINTNVQSPHCDQRILHAPGECEYCDSHEEWQYLRQMWGIAFTGWEPEDKELPDPATHARGFANANAWGGNKARPLLNHNHLGGKNMPGCPACDAEGELDES
jgi:hypothetical protein